jgi:hypothetical protein
MALAIGRVQSCVRPVAAATAADKACGGYKRPEVERFVYERLKAFSENVGPEAVREMGARLILQIASRVTALEILDAVAAGTTEIAAGSSCEPLPPRQVELTIPSAAD